MDQYRKLWDEALGGGLPILFNCINNLYGMGGQPCGETMGCRFIARIGAGVNPEQMHAERVNGYDPLAVIDAIRRKKRVLRRGQRAGASGHGHVPDQRPLALGCVELPGEGGNRALAAGRFDRCVPAHGDGKRQPSRRTCWTAPETTCVPWSSRCSGWRRTWKPVPALPLDTELVGCVMFSNRKVEKFDDRPSELLQDLADNPRVQQIRAKIRTPLHEGKPVPKMKAYNVRDAIFEALLHRFVHRPDHDRLRRGEPRLGRRICRLSRADRVAAVSPPVQLADLGGRHCGGGSWLWTGRRRA